MRNADMLILRLIASGPSVNNPHALDDGDLKAMEAIAEKWRPYRSWVALLLRTAARDGI